MDEIVFWNLNVAREAWEGALSEISLDCLLQQRLVVKKLVKPLGKGRHDIVKVNHTIMP
jgi:hypothetical protein